MKTLSLTKQLLHILIEKDALLTMFGSSSYTVRIDEQGNPIIKTLKVNKSRRYKYAK
jgi:hypothetical protein